MDKATKALAQRISILEKAVHKLQLLISAPGQQHKEPEAEQNDASQEPQNAPGSTAVVSPAPPNPPKPKDSRNSPAPWWKRVLRFIGKWRWYKILQTAGIIAGIGYAAVTYWQWRDLRHNFEVDQRAWILTDVGFDPKDPSPLSSLKTTNIGKSTALQVLTVSVFEIVDRGRDPDYLLEREHPASRHQIALLYPNRAIETAVPLLRSPKEQVAQEFTPTEIDGLRKGTSYLAVFGSVSYTDQFGMHWTRFCDWKAYVTPKDNTPGFSARSCVAWNSVGNGEPPKDKR